MNREPLLVVLSGPSGVGKDSILDRLREENFPIHFTVTATTRQPREHEQHGKDYFFLTEEEFEHLREADGLLEYALVYGHWYGVPKAPVIEALRRGTDVIMRTNVDGALTIKSRAPGSILIFISMQHAGALPTRLRIRGTESEDEIARRVQKSSDELAMLSAFDYEVVNEDGRLDKAVEEVKAIIRAEKRRDDRPPLGLS